MEEKLERNGKLSVPNSVSKWVLKTCLVVEGAMMEMGQ